MISAVLQNPHLEGAPFLWKEGSVGVLLLHGFATTTSEVRLLGGYLRARGYTVAAPLLPGHGTTPQEMNRCRWQEWVAACEDAYRALTACCECVFVGGESMGGLLALYLASIYPKVQGVLAYAPALQITSRTKPLLAPLLAPFIPMSAKPSHAPTHADAFWQGYTVRPLHAAAELFHLQQAVRARLAWICQPLLIVQGGRDHTVSSEVPAILAAESSLAWMEVHCLADSGHCVLLDAEWQQGAELTTAFIEKVLAGCA